MTRYEPAPALPEQTRGAEPRPADDARHAPAVDATVRDALDLLAAARAMGLPAPVPAGSVAYEAVFVCPPEKRGQRAPYVSWGLYTSPQEAERAALSPSVAATFVDDADMAGLGIVEMRVRASTEGQPGAAARSVPRDAGLARDVDDAYAIITAAIADGIAVPAPEGMIGHWAHIVLDQHETHLRLGVYESRHDAMHAAVEWALADFDRLAEHGRAPWQLTGHDRADWRARTSRAQVLPTRFPDVDDAARLADQCIFNEGRVHGVGTRDIHQTIRSYPASLRSWPAGLPTRLGVVGFTGPMGDA